MKRLALALFLLASIANAGTFPVIEEITPVLGPIEGGTVVTLRGKNLAGPVSLPLCGLVACEPTVTIAGKYAQLVDVAPDGTQIACGRRRTRAGGTTSSSRFA
jgi:hypothetical protein